MTERGLNWTNVEQGAGGGGGGGGGGRQAAEPKSKGGWTRVTRTLGMRLFLETEIHRQLKLVPSIVQSEWLYRCILFND